jgi:phosphoheptose isomerase
MKTNQSAREVKEQVEDSEKVLHTQNTGSVLNTVHFAIHLKLDHECLEDAVKLQNTHTIH